MNQQCYKENFCHFIIFGNAGKPPLPQSQPFDANTISNNQQHTINPASPTCTTP